MLKISLRRRWKLLILFSLLLLIIILTLAYYLFSIYSPRTSSAPTKESYHNEDAQNRRTFQKGEVLQIVHLDLKGAAPKMSYLIELVPKLASAGVTGLLVEYEDMFPYEGCLQNTSSTTPYTKSEVLRFVHYCADLNVEIIPLVQTFGHMEHVLKLEEFRHLRETPHDPRSICPSDYRSSQLICEMIEQVLSLHKFSRRIHIGCDEVFALNVCPRCAKNHRSATETFFHHVRETASFILERYNKSITPLIWDDMLRWKPHYLINESNLNNLVEIVIWDYTAELEEPIRNRIWQKYSSIFNKIWLAGAFKGADGPRSMLPSMETRFNNHKSWMRFIATAKSASPQIVGFVSTGWSRYDHFASLCELLPSSVPSLILTSLVVASGLNPARNYIGDYNGILRCRPNPNHYPDQFDLQDIFNLSHVRYCDVAESRIIFGIWQLEQLQRAVKRLYDDIFLNSGWVSEYHLKNKMLTSKIVGNELEARSFNATDMWFSQVYSMLKLELRNYYSESTTKEWIETYVEPYAAKMRILRWVRGNATLIDVWSRRGR